MATFASVPAKVTYFYATGLDGKRMDVTLTAAPADNDTPDDGPTSNKGSGGCDALSGGLLALGALGLVATRKK